MLEFGLRACRAQRLDTRAPQVLQGARLSSDWVARLRYAPHDNIDKCGVRALGDYIRKARTSTSRPYRLLASSATSCEYGGSTSLKLTCEVVPVVEGVEPTVRLRSVTTSLRSREYQDRGTKAFWACVHAVLSAHLVTLFLLQGIQDGYLSDARRARRLVASPESGHFL